MSISVRNFASRKCKDDHYEEMELRYLHDVQGEDGVENYDGGELRTCRPFTRCCAT
jgi:hypothetical protein